MSGWSQRQFIFIGGLHRSGTTLFHDLLTEHPSISGMVRTGVPMNEGQFLQDVFAPEGRYRKLWPVRFVRQLGLQALAEMGYGGPGRFAFEAGAHLTEQSSLADQKNAERIGKSWAPYWTDPSAAHLVEKSPPNMIRFRFLQELFPRSHFLLLYRHPIAVSLATKRHWRPYTTLYSLFRHWIHAHQVCREDQPYLRRFLAVRYEDLVASPESVMTDVFAFLGLSPPSGSPGRTLDPNVNQRYFEQWASYGSSRTGRVYQRFLRSSFEQAFREYGYSLDP